MLLKKDGRILFVSENKIVRCGLTDPSFAIRKRACVLFLKCFHQPSV